LLLITPAQAQSGNISIVNNTGTVSLGGFIFATENANFDATILTAYSVTATCGCTLPSAIGAQGTEIEVINNAVSTTITFLTAGGQTIAGLTSGTLTSTVHYETYRFMSDGLNWQITAHYAP
jgi:hypothetical protein